MRIVGGSARGRLLAGPKHEGLRPTADRVRQALFDILGQRVDGDRVLDLYAGTGALALEALSRGARSALLVDRSPEALELCRSNAEALGFADRARIVRRILPAGLAALGGEGELGPPYDLVFADPPYERAADLEEVLRWLGGSGILSARGVAVLEHDRRTEIAVPVPGEGRWARSGERRFGDTQLSFYRREA